MAIFTSHFRLDWRIYWHFNFSPTLLLALCLKINWYLSKVFRTCISLLQNILARRKVIQQQPDVILWIPIPWKFEWQWAKTGASSELGCTGLHLLHSHLRTPNGEYKTVKNCAVKSTFECDIQTIFGPQKFKVCFRPGRRTGQILISADQRNFS